MDPLQVKAEIVRANAVRRVEESPTFASFYANDTQVMGTPWDFRLLFGVITGVDTEKKEALVTRVAEVRMSPQHVKKLVEVLAEQIRNYEASVGFIPVPPTIETNE